VKARLLGRIRKRAQPRRDGLFSRPALGWQTALAGALGLLLAALGVGLMANREMNSLESQTQVLQELVEAQRQEIHDMAESQTEAVVVNTQAARRQYVLVSMLATPDIHVFWANRNEEYPPGAGHGVELSRPAVRPPGGHWPGGAARRPGAPRLAPAER
jgi:hypothetical protein